MTSEPPSPSDGSSLPPRHRPNLGNLIKETAEKDLWGFDEDINLSEVSSGNVVHVDSSIPAPRTQETTKIHQILDVANSTGSGKNARPLANITRIKAKGEPRTSPGPKPTNDFDDLDHWEQEEGDAKAIEKSVVRRSNLESTEIAPEIDGPQNPSEILDAHANIAPAPLKNPKTASIVDDDKNEFSPSVDQNTAAKPLKISLGLSKIERVGLLVLLALLLFGGIAAVIISLNRLPTENVRVRANDFPIKGQHLSIAAAESYWRAPVANGDHPDVVRRGTVLIPAISLKAGEGSGALRIIFRNQDGDSVGDVITRSVKPGEKLEIAATAGFDDLGMHAAYRTGETKPWVIGVYEGPSEDAAPNSFKKLFEMNISTDLR